MNPADGATVAAGAAAGLLAGRAASRHTARLLAAPQSPGPHSPGPQSPAPQQKLAAMDQMAARHRVTRLGMPDFRPAVGRSSGAKGGP